MQVISSFFLSSCKVRVFVRIDCYSVLFGVILFSGPFTIDNHVVLIVETIRLKFWNSVHWDVIWSRVTENFKLLRYFSSKNYDFNLTQFLQK